MKKLNGLDKYVIFSISFVLIYTIAEFITSTITGVEKSTLSVCVYGFWAGEVISSALIKIFKIRDTENECKWREQTNDDNASDPCVDGADIHRISDMCAHSMVDQMHVGGLEVTDV